MAAATVFYGNRVDVKPVGAQFAKDTGLGFGKVYPDINATDVSHSAYHAAGNGKGVGL